jgi:hypothetical protein
MDSSTANRMDGCCFNPFQGTFSSAAGVLSSAVFSS